MSRQISMKVIPALLLGIFAGTTAASGFQWLEQGSGLGNAYAGSAAKANDASTIYFNPAGMTQLQPHEVSLGVTAVQPRFKFSTDGSQVGAFNQAGNGGDAGSWSYPPNAYMSCAVSKDLYLGLEINAPFGLATKYDQPWTGGAHSNEFNIKAININPSIAFRVNGAVSLAAGVSWQKIDADYYRQVSATPAFSFPGVGTIAQVQAHTSISDDAWGWNLGALFTVSPSTKVGLSYRSAIQHQADGTIKLNGNGMALGNGTAGFLSSPALGGARDAQASLKVPDTFVASVTQTLSDRWEMLGDVSWTGWSSIKNLDIIRTPGAQNGVTAQTIQADFHNTTYRVALGANYLLNDAVTLQFGLAYDQTLVKNSGTRLASLPDNDRTWFTFGTQWKPANEQKFDLGVAYLHIPNTKINNNQTTNPLTNYSTLTGSYDFSVWILGAQYSIAF